MLRLNRTANLNPLRAPCILRSCLQPSPTKRSNENKNLDPLRLPPPNACFIGHALEVETAGAVPVKLEQERPAADFHLRVRRLGLAPETRG